MRAIRHPDSITRQEAADRRGHYRWLLHVQVVAARQHDQFAIAKRW